MKPATAFVAQSIEKRHAPAGSGIEDDVTQYTYARRSDRSFSRGFSGKAPDGTTGQFIDFFDSATRRVANIHPFTRSVTTYHYTEKEYWKRLNILDSENCPAEMATRAVAEGTMFGFKAIELKYEDHGTKFDQWRLPELNCFIAKEVTKIASGSWNEMEVTSIKVGEPPAELFTAPEGYTERSPLAAEQEYQAKFGREFYGWEPARRMTDHYQKTRPAQVQ